MMSRRLRNQISVASVIAVVSIAVTWRVYAQSTQTPPATMPPSGHMMHNGSPAMPDHEHMHGMTAPSDRPPVSDKSDDPRQLVSLPTPMKEHMLANMRDHLVTLDTVIGNIADAKFDAASKLLEERLGMSSLSLHHAAEMAPYFPQPMQETGTSIDFDRTKPASAPITGVTQDKIG